MEMSIVPTTLAEANAFVKQHHRHHHPARGCCFVISAQLGDAIVGVAIVGRPKARMLQDGFTAEVTRCCAVDLPRVVSSDGRSHASGVVAMLYAACWRAARAIGYRRLVTYTLPSESGASLRGAGWTEIGAAGGGSWSRKGRPRVDLHPTQTKLRWERAA